MVDGRFPLGIPDRMNIGEISVQPIQLQDTIFRLLQMISCITIRSKYQTLVENSLSISLCLANLSLSGIIKGLRSRKSLG